jgi:hypothetical protein
MAVASVEVDGTQFTPEKASREAISHAVDVVYTALAGNFIGPLTAAITLVISSISCSNDLFIHFFRSHFYLVHPSRLLFSSFPLLQRSYRPRRAQFMHPQSRPHSSCTSLSPSNTRTFHSLSSSRLQSRAISVRLPSMAGLFARRIRIRAA